MASSGVNGIYHFQFFGLKESNPADLIIFLEYTTMLLTGYKQGASNILVILTLKGHFEHCTLSH